MAPECSESADLGDEPQLPDQQRLNYVPHKKLHSSCVDHLTAICVLCGDCSTWSSSPAAIMLTRDLLSLVMPRD